MEVKGEPIGSSSADTSEGRSRRRRSRRRTPRSETLSTKAKSSSPKVDDEPLEPNFIDEGEGEVIVAEGRRRAPQVELYPRG